MNSHEANHELGIFNNPAIKQVVGQFEISMRVANKVKANWHNQECSFLCGTDGGLRDGIGTSGYIIYSEYDEDPLIEGHAAEHQPNETASSTRQELLYLGRLRQTTRRKSQ